VPERSRRYRELIRPLGLHGELRGAFVAGAAGWGAVGLLREPRAPDFSPHDAVFLRDVSGYIAHGIRTTLLLRSAARVRELTDEAFGQRRAVSEPAARPGRLSARELEVVRLMAEGLSNAQIAKRLVVSEFTVKRHVANILTKLDLPTRAAAAAYAAREGWV
jgi:DNA-binding CsgD family transcriptional regulator